MKDQALKLLLTVFSFFSPLSFLNAEEKNEFVSFRAVDSEIRISSSSLSLLEVSFKGEDITEVSLYGFKTGERIANQSKDLRQAIHEILKKEVDSADSRGPFMSDSHDFLIADHEGKILYLITRETRLRRLLITPVIDLGKIAVCSGLGKVVVGDCDLMKITSSWIP